MSDTSLDTSSPSGHLPAVSGRREPTIRPVTPDMISEALGDGLRDLRAAPHYGLAFGAFYALGGLLLMGIATRFNAFYLIYPLAAGFALIAPFVAVGTYEVSRRLQAGEPLGWGVVLRSVVVQGGRELGWMAGVCVFALIVWIDTAIILYAAFFGLQPMPVADLLDAMTSTPGGVMFFMVGNIVGGLIALVIFSISVISFPMLMDRDVDFVTAMITSVKTVLRSPGAMLGWAVFVAFMIACAMLPMFLGLIVVLPALGHASWHLYRRAIGPEIA